MNDELTFVPNILIDKTEPEMHEFFELFFSKMHPGKRPLRVFHEVPGLPHLDPYGEFKKVRCDLLLTPQMPLINAGWGYGSIVVEIKQSLKSSSISQLMDYRKTQFRLPAAAGGSVITPGLAVILPFEARGAISSCIV